MPASFQPSGPREKISKEIKVPNIVPAAPKTNAINVGPASFIILLRFALNSSNGIARGTRYDHTISYAGASVGIIERFERMNAAIIAITTAESLEPILDFSAQRLNAAMMKRTAHNAQ